MRAALPSPSACAEISAEAPLPSDYVVNNMMSAIEDDIVVSCLLWAMNVLMDALQKKSG